MTVFDFAMVAVSFVLGLAITYLLESMVGVFRARRTVRMDWLPFAWVACILVEMFQFWWFSLCSVNPCMIKSSPWSATCAF